MSKGGSSSDSASSQTPAQWAAALSNASIAAWKEADILAISLSNLQALSAAQISQIKVPWALPGAVWTADTLNAVPLQYWSQFGTRYLATTTNGVATVSPISQLSPNGNLASGNNNWFGDLGHSYQSSTGQFTFSPNVVSGINTDRIQAIGSGLGTRNAVPALNDTTLAVLESALDTATASGENVVSWSMTVSSSDQSLGISARKAYMFASGWADMGANFMAALTATQLGFIAHPEMVFAPAQFGYLTANQLIALRQMNWANVTAAQLNAISLDAFVGLQSNILSAISTTAWAGLDRAHTLKLSPTVVKLLSATTISKLSYFGYALNSGTAAVLTASQIANIQSGCWAQLSDTSFLNALPTSVFQAIPASAFTQMSATVLQNVDSQHIQNLTTAQLQSFPIANLVNATTADSLFYFSPSTIDFALFVTNTNVHWSLAPASFIQQLTATQLRLLSVTQISQLSLVAIAALRLTQTRALTLEQVQALTPAQLNAAKYISRRTDFVAQIFTPSTVTQMGKTFWSNVGSAFLNALSLDAFHAITQTQISYISEDAWAGLDQAHFNAFTISQMLALSASQVASLNGAWLTIDFLRSIRLNAFKGMTNGQIQQLHDYLFNTVTTNAFATGNRDLIQTAEQQFATLLASILESDDGREAWLQQVTDLLFSLQWLDPTAASNLSATDVQGNYSSLNWAWMSAGFLNNIMPSVFAQLKPTSIAQLNIPAVAALDVAHVQALTSDQAAALSSAQLSVINLSALQTSAVQALLPQQLAGMTVNWSTVPSTFLNKMAGMQFMDLYPSQFGQLSAQQLATTHIDWSLISAASWNALSLNDFTTLCAGGSGASPAILNASIDALLGLNGEQLSILATASMSYTAQQKYTLLTHLLGGYSEDQRYQLLGVMGKDTIDQLVLQFGLINNLAKIDGSETAFNSAIQTVLTGRAMNPDWFSAVNLNSVLPAISNLYQQAIKTQNSASIQTLFYQVFSSYYVTNELLGARNIGNTNLGIAAYVESTSLIGAQFRELSAMVRSASLAQGSEEGWSLGLPDSLRTLLATERDDFLQRSTPTEQKAIAQQKVLLESARALVDRTILKLTQSAAYQTASDPTIAHSADELSYLRAVNQTIQDLQAIKFRYAGNAGDISSIPDAGALRKALIDLNVDHSAPAINKLANTLLSGIGRQVDEAVTNRLAALSSAFQGTANTRIRVQSALALGSMLVMFGAAANEIGQAIFANDGLPSAQKDKLLAASVLGAVYSVAQGLYLPISMVVETIARWYTKDPTFDGLSLGSAIVKRFFGSFSTNYSVGRSAVAAGMSAEAYYTQVYTNLTGAPPASSNTPVLDYSGGGGRQGFTDVQAVGQPIDVLNASINEDPMMEGQNSSRNLRRSTTTLRRNATLARLPSMTSLANPSSREAAALITTNIERFLDNNVKAGYFNTGAAPESRPVYDSNGLIVGYQVANTIDPTGAADDVRAQTRASLVAKTHALLTGLDIVVTDALGARINSYFEQILQGRAPNFLVEDQIFRALTNGSLNLHDVASVQTFISRNETLFGGRVSPATLNTIVQNFSSDTLVNYINTRHATGAYDAATDVSQLRQLVNQDLTLLDVGLQEQADFAGNFHTLVERFTANLNLAQAKARATALQGASPRDSVDGVISIVQRQDVQATLVDYLVRSVEAGVGIGNQAFQENFVDYAVRSFYADNPDMTAQGLVEQQAVIFRIAGEQLEAKNNPAFRLSAFSNPADPESAYSETFKALAKALVTQYGGRLADDSYGRVVETFSNRLTNYLQDNPFGGTLAQLDRQKADVAAIWRDVWSAPETSRKLGIYRGEVVRENSSPAMLKFAAELSTTLRTPPSDIARQDIYGRTLTRTKQAAARVLMEAMTLGIEVDDEVVTIISNFEKPLNDAGLLENWLQACITAAGGGESIDVYAEQIRSGWENLGAEHVAQQVRFAETRGDDVKVAQKLAQVEVDKVMLSLAPAQKTRAFLPTIALDTAHLPEVPRYTPPAPRVTSPVTPEVREVVVADASAGANDRAPKGAFGLSAKQYQQVVEEFNSTVPEKLRVSGALNGVETALGNSLFADYLRDYLKYHITDAFTNRSSDTSVRIVNRAPSVATAQQQTALERTFADFKAGLLTYLLTSMREHFESEYRVSYAEDNYGRFADFLQVRVTNKLVSVFNSTLKGVYIIPSELETRLGELLKQGGFTIGRASNGQLTLSAVDDHGQVLTMPFKFSDHDVNRVIVDGVLGHNFQAVAGEAAKTSLGIFVDRSETLIRFGYDFEGLGVPVPDVEAVAHIMGVGQTQLQSSAEVVIAQQSSSDVSSVGVGLLQRLLGSTLDQYVTSKGESWANRNVPKTPLEILTKASEMLTDMSYKAQFIDPVTNRPVQRTVKAQLLAEILAFAQASDMGTSAQGKLAQKATAPQTIKIGMDEAIAAVVGVGAGATKLSDVALGAQIYALKEQLVTGHNAPQRQASLQTIIDSVRSHFVEPSLFAVNDAASLLTSASAAVQIRNTAMGSASAPDDVMLLGQLNHSIRNSVLDPEFGLGGERATYRDPLVDPNTSAGLVKLKQRVANYLADYPALADQLRAGAYDQQLRNIYNGTDEAPLRALLSGNISILEPQVYKDATIEAYQYWFESMADQDLGARLQRVLAQNVDFDKLPVLDRVSISRLNVERYFAAQSVVEEDAKAKPALRLTQAELAQRQQEAQDAVLKDFITQLVADGRANLDAVTDRAGAPVNFPEFTQAVPVVPTEPAPTVDPVQNALKLGSQFTTELAKFAANQGNTDTVANAIATFSDLVDSRSGRVTHDRYMALVERFVIENNLSSNSTGQVNGIRITETTVASALEAMQIRNEAHPYDYTSVEILNDAENAAALTQLTARLNKRFIGVGKNNPEIATLEESDAPLSVNDIVIRVQRSEATTAGLANLRAALARSGANAQQLANVDAVAAGLQHASSTATNLDVLRVEATLDETTTETRSTASNADVSLRSEAVTESEITLQVRLSKLGTAIYSLGLLGWGIFASVVGVAAGIAGIIYAATSTQLSDQAKYLSLAMNGVRVASSVLMLGASSAQIVANVAKTVVEVESATAIAERGFILGGVIGVTTSLAQIGLQIHAVATATDSTSRLIAGLAILDASIQLIINVAGLLALVFGGPAGAVINLITFVIGSLVPSFSAIAQAVELRKSYDNLLSEGLHKEAEVVYVNWQIASLDAAPIVNWVSSIYTTELQKDQKNKMDHVWLDKAGEERLLYFIKNSTDLLNNFNQLRSQLYAGTAAINQSFVNLSQGLTRATMLMLSQEDLSYFNDEVTATVKLAATFRYNANTVNRAPKLISAVVHGQTLTLTFNQNLASLSSQLPKLSSFGATVNGATVTVSGLALLNNVVTLTLATAVTAGQVVTFSYQDSTVGDDVQAVQNLLGNDAASIVAHAVVNTLDTDTRAPVLADAVVQDVYLSLTFDEALNNNDVPSNSAFAVTVAGSHVNVLSVAVSGNRVLLTLAQAVNVGDTVAVTYTPTGTHTLRDATGNQVQTFTSGSGGITGVDNTSTVATVTASRLGWLQYDNFVASIQGTGTEAASVLNGSDYTVYSSESDSTNSTSRLRYLSLSNVFGEFDNYSVSRAQNNNDKVLLDASGALGTVSFAINTSGMTVRGGQGTNSYTLQRDYANNAYIVAANSWSANSNVVNISPNATGNNAGTPANTTVNLDHFLSADNISGGLAVNQSIFKVIGASDGLDVVIGNGHNQSYYATSNVANVTLNGDNANVFVGESSQVKVGLNAQVLVDMDMWRALNAPAPSVRATKGSIKGGYGSSSLLNFSPTDTINDSFIGSLNLQYRVGQLPTTGAFNVNVAGTVVPVSSVAVNGQKVTLTLTQSVQQGQAVKVSYTDLSTSNVSDVDTLMSIGGTHIEAFSNITVNNITADVDPPQLMSATMSSNVLWMRFDRQLNTGISTAALRNALTVLMDGEPVLISSVQVQGNKIAVTTSTLPTKGQNVEVTYQPIAGPVIVSTSGVFAGNFFGEPVVNTIGDSVAPVVTSAIANGTSLLLVFSEPLRNDATSSSSGTLTDFSAGGFDVSGFTVSANGTNVTVNSVAISGNGVVLTLGTAVQQSQNIKVSYTAPQVAASVADGSDLCDWAGNNVSNFVIGSAVAPQLVSVLGRGNQVLLTYDSALQVPPRPDLLIAAFNVFSGVTSSPVQNVLVNGNTVLLTTATPISTNIVTPQLNYSPATLGNPALGLFGANGVAVSATSSSQNVFYSYASFDSTAPVLQLTSVNNVSGLDVKSPTLLHATANGKSLVLTFDEALSTVAGFVPSLAAFTVVLNSTTNVTLNNMKIVDNTVILTMAQSVGFGDAVSISYTDFGANVRGSANTLQDVSGNEVNNFYSVSVLNTTLDNVAPTLSSITVNGNYLTMQFSEFLDTGVGRLPPVTNFTIKQNGVPITVISGNVTDNTISFTLANAVQARALVTVDYTAPSATAVAALQDSSGNHVASIVGSIATNNTGRDTTPPSLLAGVVSGNAITLTFSEQLTSQNPPSIYAFGVYVDGSNMKITPSSVSVSGQQVSLTLPSLYTVTPGQTVLVSYFPNLAGTGGALTDSSRNALAAFSLNPMGNQTQDTTPPTIDSASIEGARLQIKFSETLASTSATLPNLTQFSVTVDGSAIDLVNESVSGNVLTLLLSKAVTGSQTVSVNYTQSTKALATNNLQDGSGNLVTGFSLTTASASGGVHFINNSGRPSLQLATVKGKTLTMTFNQVMDGEALYLPALSDFVVLVSGSSVTPADISVQGNEVILTLPMTVYSSDTVVVNYANATSGNDLVALQNQEGLDVFNIESYPVLNLSSQYASATPTLTLAEVKDNMLTLTFGGQLNSGVGEWAVSYFPDNGAVDANGVPVSTSQLQASGFLNLLGSNGNDTFVIGDQSTVSVNKQLRYIQLGGGNNVQLQNYDTSDVIVVVLSATGRADVTLEAGSSLQVVSSKLVQTPTDVTHFMANRDTVTLQNASSLSAFLGGYETIDASNKNSSLTVEIGVGDHQIKLGGQTANFKIDKVNSHTTISAPLIPTSWTEYQFLSFQMDGSDLWLGKETDGTLLIRGMWNDLSGTGQLSVNYDGAFESLVIQCDNVLVGQNSTKLRVDKLIEVMASPGFSSDPQASRYATTVSDTSNGDTNVNLYRVNDIVQYSLTANNA